MEKKPELRFKMEKNAIVGSVRLPNAPEAAWAAGNLVTDILITDQTAKALIGQVTLVSNPRLKIGRKFKVTLYFEEMTEEEYMAIITNGLVPMSDGKNKDVGVV